MVDDGSGPAYAADVRRGRARWAPPCSGHAVQPRQGCRAEGRASQTWPSTDPGTTWSAPTATGSTWSTTSCGSPTGAPAGADGMVLGARTVHRARAAAQPDRQRGDETARPDRRPGCGCATPRPVCAATRRSHAGLAAATVEGDRFEYELDLLLRATQDGVRSRRFRSRRSTSTGTRRRTSGPSSTRLACTRRCCGSRCRRSLAFLVDTVALLALFAADRVAAPVGAGGARA